MNADTLFRIANLTALLGWLLLLGTGWSQKASRWTASLVSGFLLPALLSTAYLALLATHWRGHHGRFDSLSNVMLLFTDRWLVLAGWIHYLAFDLFIGSWQVRDRWRSKAPFWFVVPCLGLTFMFGPIGLLLYLLGARAFSTRV